MCECESVYVHVCECVYVHVCESVYVHVLMRDEKEGRSKQGQTNKAKQHSTPLAACMCEHGCTFM